MCARWQGLSSGSTGNVSLLHVSKYVTAHDEFHQAFPTLVLQATSAGVIRPGYEATVLVCDNMCHLKI